MNPKLNPSPCPVCCQEPTIVDHHRAQGGRFALYHGCDEKPGFHIELSDFYKTPAEAVKDWNDLIAALAGKTEDHNRPITDEDQGKTKMSDTPRTDAQVLEIISRLQSGVEQVVRADFARKLEREVIDALAGGGINSAQARY